jgi:hypothetical protein
VVHIARGADASSTVDLIAWSRKQPGRVFQCLGVVEALGVDQIANPATWFAWQSLPVYRRPIDWLRGDCKGIVIFDAKKIRTRLEQLPTRRESYALLAESLDHGRALRRILTPVPKTVRIMVPHREENVA